MRKPAPVAQGPPEVIIQVGEGLTTRHETVMAPDPLSAVVNEAYFHIRLHHLQPCFREGNRFARLGQDKYVDQHTQDHQPGNAKGDAPQDQLCLPRLPGLAVSG